jgi:hypothetical protein
MANDLVDTVKKFDLRPMAQAVRDTAEKYMGPVTNALGLTGGASKPDITPQAPPGTPAANREVWEAKGLPGRAKGGPVKKGKKYVVGEKGPEVFVPKQSGKIVPNNKMPAQPPARGYAPPQPVAPQPTFAPKQPVAKPPVDLSQLRKFAKGGGKKKAAKPPAKAKAKAPAAPKGAFPWSRG